MFSLSYCQTCQSQYRSKYSNALQKARILNFPLFRTFTISNFFAGPVGVRDGGCLLYLPLCLFLKKKILFLSNIFTFDNRNRKFHMCILLFPHLQQHLLICFLKSLKTVLLHFMKSKYTTNILLAKSARTMLWYPLTDFYFETVEGIGFFYLCRNNLPNFGF